MLGVSVDWTGMIIVHVMRWMSHEQDWYPRGRSVSLSPGLGGFQPAVLLLKDWHMRIIEQKYWERMLMMSQFCMYTHAVLLGT